MKTLCETYPTQAAVRDATEAFSASGVPHHNIRLLIGHRLHDIRYEPVGGFGGSVDPDAPVGKFSGPPRAALAGRGRLLRQSWISSARGPSPTSSGS